MGRSFHLGDILSVTTGRLVSTRHMDGIYDLLNYMTGNSLFTHQLPRACDECKPEILDQHPVLARVRVPEEFADGAHVDRWLAEQVERFGEFRDIDPLPTGKHARIHPLDELAMMAPGVPGVVVALPDEPPPPVGNRVRLCADSGCGHPMSSHAVTGCPSCDCPAPFGRIAGDGTNTEAVTS